MFGGMAQISVFATLTVMVLALGWVNADEMGTNFFLKASKSVPRIGRRGDVDFLKASKSVPRIGRRRDMDLPIDPAIFGKRYYAEKDSGESGQPWGANDLSNIMQGDEPYHETDHYLEPYWRPTTQQRAR